ncbi:hypothetical protein KKG83_04870 [Candidatus Micrarchaeota archaeon]|nr:hypothetical protein [Candidatus Micrarchaeota archaeon]MBU2476778.1 hypothetical protein [Candidatus Micrarchaeota archaeon]
MNVFKIIVSFLILVYLIFFIQNVFFPAAFPEEKIIEQINQQIIFSKKNLGQFNAKYEISFQKDVSLTEKALETTDTKIEFQCNSFEKCCAENDKCNSKIQWTKKSVFFNEKSNPVVSTRCEEIKGTFFCKIYLGDVPAQVKLVDFSYTNNFYFNSEKLKIQAKILNAGQTTENFAVLETTVLVVFFEQGEKKEEIIKTDSSSPEKIMPQETKTIEREIELDSPGEYLVKVKITGMDYGFVEKEFTANVYGEPDYDCRINQEKKEVILKSDSSTPIPECTIRYYCFDCLYGFECKYTWKKEFPEKNFEIGTNEFTTENTRGPDCR